MTASLAPRLPTIARATRRARAEIHKFGGAALADGAAIAHAASLVAGRADAPTVVVASALAGVTDALLEAVHAADAQDTVIEELRARHLRALHEVAGERLAAAVRPCVDHTLDALACAIVAARAEPSAAALDRVLACGERLAARLLASALEARDVAAVVVDATEIIHADGAHGDALPDLERTTRAARAALRPLLDDGVVPVVPGFIARAPEGAVVTLGRGGSDLTATLLARALGATEVVLWKDVPGLLTADPLAVPDARVLARVDAEEAAALAHYGAKVLHPRALAPLGARARVHIRPFASPASAHSEIRAASGGGGVRVRAIAARSGQCIVTVTARADAFPRLASLTAGACETLARAGLASALVAQSAGDRTARFTLAGGEAARAADVLRLAFAGADVATRDGVTTIGIVGRGVEAHAAVLTHALGALADAHIPVIASTLGATDASLAIVVDDVHAVAAQRALHAAFRLHQAGGGAAVASRHHDVVLLGAGAIGCALLGQLRDAREGTLPLRVVAVLDRSGFVFEPRGLSRARLAALAALKRHGRPLTDAPDGCAGCAESALERITAHALAHPVLVDATAADTSELLERALARGFDLVLANKVPLAGDQDAFDRLRALARRHGRQLLHEATVGAGLPVIDTLGKLLESGDTVLRIEGCPSGTLGFLFGELGRGRAFSDAVCAAMRAGYTEPDPRVDLSGVDVARKALILARLIGFRGSLDDVRVESLVPDTLRDVPHDELLARLPALDDDWRARVEAARARGRVLRYRARITRRAVRIGLVAVERGDPLGALEGTDNQFAFTTTRYRPQPLVITGPGAGREVTAAGVLTDLLRLAALRRGSR